MACRKVSQLTYYSESATNLPGRRPTGNRLSFNAHPARVCTHGNHRQYMVEFARAA